jgi:hypothetical protein
MPNRQRGPAKTNELQTPFIQEFWPVDTSASAHSSKTPGRRGASARGIFRKLRYASNLLGTGNLR